VSVGLQNETNRQFNANLVLSAIQSVGVRTHGMLTEPSSVRPCIQRAS